MIALRLCLLAGVMATATGCSALPVGAEPAATAPSPAITLTSAPTALPPSPTLRPTPAPSPTVRPTSTPRPEPTAIPTVRPTDIPPPTVTPSPAPLSADERQQIFDEVWRTVREHYLYVDFHGLDWDAIHDEYEPRIEAEQSRDQFYATMVEMVARLNDQHSRFLPPAAAQTENAIAGNYEVTVGIGVLTRPKADGAFIQIVFPDSPADRAGLAPRDRIITVDGRPYRPDDGDLLGEAGSTVRLTVVRPGEKKPRDVVLTRQEVQNHIEPYYRRFPGDIGYVSIPTLWVEDMDEQVNGALTDLEAEGDLYGVIIDLRGNQGGWRSVLSGLLTHFVRGQVGVFYDRRKVHPLDVPAPSGPDMRHKKLAVLVDNETASYAELLAAILQRENHAVVVGTRSAGNTETIYATTLSDGSRLWLAEEGFRLQSGDNLEGVGIQPDSTVDVDWTHYSEDDDPQLLEALRLLGAGPK